MLDDLKELIETSDSKLASTSASDATIIYKLVLKYIEKWGLPAMLHHLRVWLYLAESVESEIHEYE